MQIVQTAAKGKKAASKEQGNQTQSDRASLEQDCSALPAVC
jgi:hypothetical protein